MNVMEKTVFNVNTKKKRRYSLLRIINSKEKRIAMFFIVLLLLTDAFICIGSFTLSSFGIDNTASTFGFAFGTLFAIALFIVLMLVMTYIVPRFTHRSDFYTLSREEELLELTKDKLTYSFHAKHSDKPASINMIVIDLTDVTVTYNKLAHTFVFAGDIKAYAIDDALKAKDLESEKPQHLDAYRIGDYFDGSITALSNLFLKKKNNL